MFKFNGYIKEKYMSLELLKKRLNYYGGNQQQRMINDKLRSLKKALLYSYQAATAVLSDGREFRCLINPDKNKPAYDNNIISIPFKDICLNRPRVGKRNEGEEIIGLKPGDVFIEKQKDLHWLVYLQIFEEDAYFRSEIRRCDQEITVNGQSYWVYLRGPVETSIEWTQKKNVEWNTLNYSMVMYITADQNTNNYFERFQLVKITDPRYGTTKNWHIVGVDPYYGDGILQVFLDEFFENSIKDAEEGSDVPPNSDQGNEQVDTAPKIDGPTKVKQYSKAYYQIKNAAGGHWYLSWKGQEQDLKSELKIIPLNVSIGEKGTFTLIYRRENEDDITLDVTITSL